METKKFYLTKEGLEKIKKEYEFLKNLRLAKTSGEAPKIFESEDLNPEYVSFQEDLEIIEGKIVEIENILRNVVLIEAPKNKQKTEIVELGTTVSVEINGHQKDELTIVGTVEANPALGRISGESPVGKALLGHKIGEAVIISSPIKTVYKIKKIRYNLD